MSNYKFGPLESTGIFGDLSMRQLVAAAVGFIASLIALTQLGSGRSLMVALVIAGVTFAFVTMPVLGRPAVDWTDIAIRFGIRRFLGRLRYESQAMNYGHIGEIDGEAELETDLPPAIESIEILGAMLNGHEVGVAYDADWGAYTASIAVTADSFALLDDEEQQAKLQGWAAVLADLARDDCPVSRIQWIETTLPANQDELREYLVQNVDTELGPNDPNVMSYVKLLSGAASVQQEHELLLVLRLDMKKRSVRKMASRLGKHHDGYCALLMREMEHFITALGQADVRVVGPLRPRTLARVVRGHFNPYAVTDQMKTGVAPQSMGPIYAEEDWDTYECEGVLHTTYWVVNFPRIGVGPTFLSPLLLNTSVLRTVSMTVEPVPHIKAMRDVQSAATSEEASADARESRGFRTSASKRRVYQGIMEREQELASGHAEVRFSAFVTVSGRTREELDAACAEIEHAASQSHLELRRLLGEQGTAISYTMPLCRGLKSGLV